MRLVQFVGSAAALASHAYGQAQSTKSCDSVTKICFQTYTVPATGVQYGIALPMNVTAPFDAIISITAPVATKWAGFSWGGTMVFNPLTVAWPNGNSATVSARFAFGLSLPQGYDEAEHTLMKGTTTNSTHWTMVARCRGCTSYQDNNAELATINATGTAPFAWAQGVSAPQEPANNASAFAVHQAVGKWQHDLSAARSPDFESWIAANLVEPAPPVKTSTTTSAASTTFTTTTKATNTVAAGIPASCAGAGAAKFQSVLASGWKATKVIGGLTSPRSIVFDTAGNMLVVQSGKGISLHVMSADGCISSTKMLVSQNNLNHGISLSVDGKTLYASTSTTVYSWPYTASSTSVGTRGTVITGMYNGGAHVSRTLLIAPHQPNLLVVSHGSNDNFDYASGNPKTGRAIVKVFDLSKAPANGYNYPNDGWLAGYGLRNEVGITFDGNNMLWGVENSGDNFQRTAQGQSPKDVHQDNPAEKLNYLGDVTQPNNNWYGYPTCFAVWKPSDFTDQKFQVGDQFVIAPNNTFKDVNCDSVSTPPALVFQAHSAPIDSKFDPTFSTLYVTFHGSWNRQPTTGFKVVAVPFTKGTDGAYKPVAPRSSNTGYTDIFSNPNVAGCSGNGPVMSSGCFRPAGLGFDSAGRMYMTSDTTADAEIFVLGKS
ncbi:Uncharacterized protein BP5553_09317 [Venustampulla echinocandica]|uniref:Uncharacterized protein n=1 Tax=Venustampulla echinocandica TaxID=2656787 RepID=A0A370TCF3_9HELO|nr:Uncharacterized protein BP5553_09317 [Venustampulla echinocandica]RDL31915.1 Uncharacterized protein BP5553_09317 [Venustampulla echinocandica]